MTREAIDWIETGIDLALSGEKYAGIPICAATAKYKENVKYFKIVQIFKYYSYRLINR